MEYQDFLQLAGTTDDIVTEEDFEYIIQPVMEDRRDLFPTDEAVIAYYNIFGLDGFTDDFFDIFDDLVERLQDARRMIGVGQTRFLKLVELAVNQI